MLTVTTKNTQEKFDDFWKAYEYAITFDGPWVITEDTTIYDHGSHTFQLLHRIVGSAD